MNTRKKRRRDGDEQTIDSADDATDESIPEPKQEDTPFSFFEKKKCTKKRADELIMNYIVSDMRPLSTVESHAFKQMILGINPSIGPIMSRKTLAGKIDESLLVVKKEMIQLFEKVDYVTMTCDIWSSNNKSFMGVTAHVLDSQNKFVPMVLAVRRFAGAHTFDRISDLLFAIFREYGLDKNLSKIRAIVTDNASNFVKAFKELGKSKEQESSSEFATSESDTPDEESMDSESEELDVVDVGKIFDRVNVTDVGEPELGSSVNPRSGAQDQDELEAGVRGTSDSYSDLPDRIVNTNDDDSDISEPEGNDGRSDSLGNIGMYLPPHFRCSSHTLNLLATTDAKYASNTDVSYKRNLQSVKSKCQGLWNSLSHSSKNNDLLKEVFEKKLIRPNATRWNSEYDALKRILECHMAGKLSAVCDVLKKPRFKTSELEFLAEYVSVLEPIAIALDMLQGEEKAYFGTVLPTIKCLERKLVKLHQSVKLTRVLTQTLLEGLGKRFPFLSGSPAVHSDYHLATWSLPFFKDKFGKEEHKELVLGLMTEEAITMKQKMGATSEKSSGIVLERSPEAFFDFSDDESGTSTQQPTVANTVKIEILRYLSDSRKTLSILQEYPAVNSVFRKYNCMLPTSAPVERLFSKGGIIMSPRRNSLADGRFESLVLLKANEKFKVFQQNMDVV